MGEHLTDEDRELLGGPTGPWIRDDWDQLLGYVEHIVAAHIARATADAEIVRAEWERQYGYAAEAAERFRRQAADAEARLATTDADGRDERRDGAGGSHVWLLRPESDTYECLICGAEQ